MTDQKKEAPALGGTAPNIPTQKGHGSPNTRPTTANAPRGSASVNLSDRALQSPVAAAAVLIAQGWSVLPLQPRSKDPLGALVPHGFKDATQDLALVERWFAEHPAANLGAVPPEGCFVIDVDSHKSEEYAKRLDPLVQRLAGLHTPLQRSGGGGTHFVLRGPPPSQTDLRKLYGPGIDVKAHGRGYVAVAPSLHGGTGAFYEWGKPPIIKPADVPAWLLDGMPASAPDHDDDLLAPAKVVPLVSIDNAPLPDLPLEVARDALRHLPPSQWDDYDQWLRIGFALHAQFDGSAEALALWDAASSTSPKFEAGVCAAKWSGMRDDKESNYTMRSVLHEARLHGWQDPRTQASASGVLRLYNPLHHKPKRTKYILGAPVYLPDLSEQVIFFGKSESFKSVSVQGLCVHMAAGVSLDGRAVPPRVVVYAAEEAPFLFDNNLHAWRQHFAQTLDTSVFEHAHRNLELGYLQRIDGNIEMLDDRRAKELGELVRQQQHRLGSNERPVVVLDPVAEVMGGDESKAPEMRKYIGAGRRLQRDTGALVVHVHHVGHSETDRERGSSTLPAAMFVRYHVKRETAGSYVLELHCQKHKARQKPTPSRWQVVQTELMPEAGESEPTTGVVLQLLGDAAPHVSQADVVAAAHEQQLQALVLAYHRDPTIGANRLKDMLGCGAITVQKLRQQAIDRGLLQAGGGSGRAEFSITEAGRAMVGTAPPDADEDDLLG